MIKISDAVEEMVAGSDFFRFGLYHRVLNLAQVARFVRPMIEATTRKPVRTSAITMALSRIQRQIADEPSLRDFRIERINLQVELSILTFPKLDTLRAELRKVYAALDQGGGYMTMTGGTSEVTVIVDRSSLADILNNVSTRPVSRHDQISGIGVRFGARYEGTPGLLYEILQQLAIQRINIVELASTRSELNIYVDDSDVRLAFDSLYARFMQPEA